MTPDFISHNWPIPAWSIIQYDWCDWIVVPATTWGITCWDVQSCITGDYIMSTLNDSASILRNGTRFDVNMSFINNNINSSWAYPILTIGNTSHDLSDIIWLVNLNLSDWVGFSNITNGWDIIIRWRDWITTTIVWQELHVWLPQANRNNWWVLAWNETTARSERQAPEDSRCNAVPDCIQLVLDGLQNQINNLQWGWAWGSDDFTTWAVYDNWTQIITFSRQLWWSYGVNIWDIVNSIQEQFVDTVALLGNTLTLTMADWSTKTADLSPLASDTFVSSTSIEWSSSLRLTRNDWTNIDLDLQPLVAATQTDDFTVSWLLNAGTWVLTMTRDSWSTYTVDLSALQDANDYTIWGSLIWWGIVRYTRLLWGTYDVDLSSITAWVNTDEVVRITANDTTASFLEDAIANAVTTVTDNDWTIEKRVVNPAVDESLMLSVNLTLYTGDTQFVWNHTQTWDSIFDWESTFTTWPVNFNWVTLEHTWTTTNYDWASTVNNAWTINNIAWSTINNTDNTINNDGTTENYLGDSVVNLADWATITNNLDWDITNNLWANYTENNNYTDWATVNNAGNIDNNYAADYVENNTYADGSIINNDWWVTNNNNTTENNTAVTENYNDVPVQISCEWTAVIWTWYTAPVDTQYAEIEITYNNTVDAPITQTISTILDGNTQVVAFQTDTNPGEVTITWATWVVTVTVTWGTPANFSIVDICYYNGVSTINQTNVINQNYWWVTENSNNYESNTNTTQVFDENSSIVNNGSTVLENLEVENITINNPATIWFQKWLSSPITGTSTIINDPLVTTESLVFINSVNTPVWVVTATTWAWTITIESSATESWLVVSYVVFY